MLEDDIERICTKRSLLGRRKKLHITQQVESEPLEEDCLVEFDDEGLNVEDIGKLIDQIPWAAVVG